MKKLAALFSPPLAGLALITGAAYASPAPAARAVNAADPSAVKAGVDAWSAGDYSTAVRLWQPLADRGDPDALFNLAQAYKLGRGVPADLARAEDLYGKAAAKGHVQAADSYGLMLFQSGEREKALPFVQASAARGEARAMYILGVAYFNGDVVPKDWERAYALTSLARDAGLAQATRALTQMDQHIPLATRQKSVLLGQQLAAEAEANRQRISASSELGTSPASESMPELVAASPAPAPTAKPVHSLNGPAYAGADYTRPKAVAQPIAPRPVVVSPALAASTRPASRPAPKPALSPPGARPAAAIATGGPWRVQLGAFGVAGNAEALWAKVRARPELAGHSRALVPAGRLTKLQATGFASQAGAQAACSRLSGAGVTCLVVRD
ncbi:hypothetical protein WSK_2623 [Novosphingobium sp. Rr 2-17]|uniref:SPOR domain-containing protein n=1 Tax=Novosphingobium sp. Rr 2-17 TaxID=555793 RepID=UPI0002698548|nr:SPOR domain-containing protein [Novosphingobium sp. Rr 2-17]EIZ78576.1 hypothetical protein WSK_2623 [Novosphingobium sp. Rr 2-17]